MILLHSFIILYYLFYKLHNFIRFLFNLLSKNITSYMILLGSQRLWVKVEVLQ